MQNGREQQPYLSLGWSSAISGTGAEQLPVVTRTYINSRGYQGLVGLL